LGIKGVNLAPRCRDVDAAVSDDGRGFVAAAALGEVGVPGEAQLVDVTVRDLVQGAEALFAVVLAVGAPLTGVAGPRGIAGWRRRRIGGRSFGWNCGVAAAGQRYN